MKNRISRLSKQTKSIDRKLLFLILAFVVIGIIAVADVSAPQALNTYGDKFYFLKLHPAPSGNRLHQAFTLSQIGLWILQKL